ncbi:APC family permease [Streptomyces djakartensis]|uniref:APC family permease n=1 Tax=Streptomyces djakartensis TaxID=68193 RepID=UPI0034DF049F
MRHSVSHTRRAEAASDASQLEQLGYDQELRRGLGVFGNISMGFATISPVVGLYAVSLVGTLVAGPMWLLALPVALIGNLLLVSVYAELASQYPISGGAYQWTRRLVGPRYAWVSGWLSVCAYLAANTTIAYLAAPWGWALFGAVPTPNQLVATAAGFIVVASVVNAYGIDLLRKALAAGVAAEFVASVVVGLGLLLFCNHNGLAILVDDMGTVGTFFGGSTMSAMLAVLAVAGWAFIGLDACIAASEETRDAARNVPKALWGAMLAVGTLVVLNAVAVTLAHPNLEGVVSGEDLDPVTTAVVAGFGGWATKPFVIVVLIAFFACGLAAQGATARIVYSMARDHVLPFSSALRKVNERQAPIGGIVAVTIVGVAGLLLGLNSAAIGSLIAFGTAVIYLVFFLIAAAALWARLIGRWVPAGTVRMGRLGTVVNVAAAVWLGFEFINIAWPRAILAPIDAPWYQVWAGTLVTVIVIFVGAAYLLARRPDRLVAAATSFATTDPVEERM